MPAISAHKELLPRLSRDVDGQNVSLGRLAKGVWRINGDAHEFLRNAGFLGMKGLDRARLPGHLNWSPKLTPTPTPPHSTPPTQPSPRSAPIDWPMGKDLEPKPRGRQLASTWAEDGCAARQCSTPHRTPPRRGPFDCSIVRK